MNMYEAASWEGRKRNASCSAAALPCFVLGEQLSAPRFLGGQLGRRETVSISKSRVGRARVWLSTGRFLSVNMDSDWTQVRDTADAWRRIALKRLRGVASQGHEHERAHEHEHEHEHEDG